MTLKNLKLALQLNNGKYNEEINAIIDFLNQLYQDQEVVNYEIKDDINNVSLTVERYKRLLDTNISGLGTRIDSLFVSLSDHINNQEMHIGGAINMDDYAKKEDLHEHENKETLDGLSQDEEGVLLFNGDKIKGGEEELTEEEIQALILAILQELGTPEGHGEEEGGTSGHKHLNKRVLDKLNENESGQLTYNGKLVSYGGSSSGSGDQPVSAGIYFSELEQPIGETEEGNTIYQITKHFTTNGTNGQEISHEISNIGTVVNIQGIMFDNKNKIPLGFNDNDNNYFSCIINLEKIKLFHTFGENKDVYITIQYTRTGNRFVSSDDYYVISSDDYILAGNAE